MVQSYQRINIESKGELTARIIACKRVPRKSPSKIRMRRPINRTIEIRDNTNSYLNQPEQKPMDDVSTIQYSPGMNALYPKRFPL